MNPHYEWRTRTGVRIALFGVSAVLVGYNAATTDDTFLRIVDAAAIMFLVLAIVPEIRRLAHRGRSSTGTDVHDDHAGSGDGSGAPT